MKLTLNQIRTNGPCPGGWRTLLESKGKTQADDEYFSLIDVINSNGLDDALWCLGAVEGHDKEIRLYAVWCARQVQHLMEDQRSIDALDVAESFAKGTTGAADMAAAWAAAGAATGDVAWAAARAAARAAAGAAAGAAAWAAAGAAARAAAWAAAGAAARAAARAAAGAAAWDAARAAAWDAARASTGAAQTEKLIELCMQIDAAAASKTAAVCVP